MSVGIWIFNLGWSLLRSQRPGVEFESQSVSLTCCRNGRFIPVGGELVRTLDLTLIVPRARPSCTVDVPVQWYGARAWRAIRY
ncbi:hypothetical protein B296_00003611 [Ensete ventricosum]|uniref:Uncharacterized protein n=1 Tax=Ensete ventricosum TaxID=4639 RepID=A0A427BCA1_ENSVE|nr:hypothetical protein B296_00003611 [Ensete ventricosum]